MINLLGKSAVAYVLLCSGTFAADPSLTFAFATEKLDFSTDDIANAYVAADSEANRPIVVVYISQSKVKDLAMVTSRHIGESMDLIVCGKVVSSPHIMEALNGRYFQISGGIDLKEANTLAAQLKTGSCN